MPSNNELIRKLLYITQNGATGLAGCMSDNQALREMLESFVTAVESGVPGGPTGPTGPAGSNGATGATGSAGDSSLSGFIETPSDKTYVLMLYAKQAFTINNITIKTTSGTCTAAVQIDGVNVTSLSGLSVTSVEQTVNATGANSVVAGNTISLVISSNASAADLQFTIGMS